ncbi:hypothetical protein P4E94_09965 [Pontiellaceae bacterium B12219]|nr:hypothetical protein [Pontiellaceae bacterium B12219]
MNKRTKTTMAALGALLLGVQGVQAAVWTWDNDLGDNVFTNSANWSSNEFPSNETMVVSLSGANRAILSDGMETLNMDGIRVSYVSGDVGEVEQTGGIMNMTALASRESVIGHGGGTGIWTQSGGTNHMNNITIGAGGGNGLVTLSGGLMEVADTFNGNSIIVGTESESSVGTFELAGGMLKTAYGISLGKDNGGTSTFHLNGGDGVFSNGVLNGATSGNWYQDATSTLKATIDSDDGFSLGQIIISSGSNDLPTVTFQYGALIDIAFSGADMGDVTNSWDLITWPTNTVVADNGLNFDTNTVDLTKWSFAITNNALRVTYGIGSEVVVIENPPPTGPRTLYWTGNGSDMNATNAANWAVDLAGTEATWGVYEEDTIYVGHSSVNAEDSVSESTFSGLPFANQSRLYIGNGRTGIVNFDAGEIILPKPNGSARSSYIGWGNSAGVGILNVNGGTPSLYATELGAAGANGIINLTGGELLLPGRIASAGAGTDGRASLWVGGAGGTGTVNISGGAMNTLIGVVLGNATGVGTFHVDGSGASVIDLGSTRSNYDGFWHQNAGSTLKVTIDEGGVTPINVREDGSDNDGERVGLADIVFEAGSILDVSWASGVTKYGYFDVMTFGGTVEDKGLALAPGIDTNIWSFNFVDTDSDGTNDTLRVTAYGETGNGTPYPWLAEYGLTDADDDVDIDNDGMMTWEEYIAGTNPTNAASVLTVNSFSNVAGDYVITWQSVEGKSYSVLTNLDLVYGTPGAAASGIVAVTNETSYTSSVPASSAVFFEIGVE